MNDRARDGSTSPTGHRVAVHLIWATVVLALAAVPVYFWWSARASAGALREDVASTFRAAFQGDVTHRFYSSAPELAEGHGLELASLRTSETFERTHVQRFLGIEGRSEVRIDVPVTYRYQVPWDTGWRVVLTRAAPGEAGDPTPNWICVAEAPALEPQLPPAIHTQELRIDRSKEWRLQRFESAMVDSVLAEITPVTSDRARSEEYRTLVRETARRRLKSFLRLWLLQLEEVPEGMKVDIFVSFADDEPSSAANDVVAFREFEIR